MANLLATADALRNLSDSQLRQAYSSGSVPQFLALTELQRRQSMRAEYAQRDPNNAADTSIADKLLMGVGELPTSEQIAANMALTQQPPVAPGGPQVPGNNGGSAGTPMPSGPGGYTQQAPANPGGSAQGFAMGAKKFSAGGRVGMASGGLPPDPWRWSEPRANPIDLYVPSAPLARDPSSPQSRGTNWRGNPLVPRPQPTEGLSVPRLQGAIGDRVGSRAWWLPPDAPGPTADYPEDPHGFYVDVPPSNNPQDVIETPSKGRDYDFNELRDPGMGSSAPAERNYDRNELTGPGTSGIAGLSVAQPPARSPGAGAEVRGDRTAANVGRGAGGGGGVGGGAGGGGGIPSLASGRSGLTDRMDALRGAVPDRFATADNDLVQEKVELDRQKGENTGNALIRFGSAMMEGGAKSGDFFGILGSAANVTLTDAEKRVAEQNKARRELAHMGISMNAARQTGDLGILGIAQHDKASEEQRATQLEIARMNAAQAGAGRSNALEIARMQIEAGKFDKAWPVAMNLARLGGRETPNDDDYRTALAYTHPSLGNTEAQTAYRQQQLALNVERAADAALGKDPNYTGLQGTARDAYRGKVVAEMRRQAGLSNIPSSFDLTK